MMNKKQLIQAVLAILAIGFLPLLAGYLFFSTWSDRGAFGDLFGSTNALFSGLAFAGLIYTIALQREELALQRTELKLQREEMVASRAHLAAQAEAQAALFHATVAQVRVASEQARVEAVKMESEKRVPGARDNYVNQVNLLADQIQAIANSLESTKTGD